VAGELGDRHGAHPVALRAQQPGASRTQPDAHPLRDQPVGTQLEAERRHHPDRLVDRARLARGGTFQDRDVGGEAQAPSEPDDAAEVVAQPAVHGGCIVAQRGAQARLVDVKGGPECAAEGDPQRTGTRPPGGAEAEARLVVVATEPPKTNRCRRVELNVRRHARRP